MKSAECSVFLHRLIRFCIGAVLAVSLFGCSTLSPAPLHSFGFDVFPTSGAELLDRRYGSGSTKYRRANPADVVRGKIKPSGNVGAFMEVGDSLYVKWRILDSGQIFEETVDLRNRLPSDMTNHTIYFEVENKQLKVYLATPKLREHELMVDPLLYRCFVVFRLHPIP